MSVRSGVAFVAALAFSLFATVAADAAPNRPSLIAARGDAGAGSGMLVRSRPVTPDFAVLGAARDSLTAGGGTQSMDIAFFDDVVIGVNVERVTQPGNGVTNYFGGIEGDPYGRAVITNSRGNVAVTVYTTNRTYTVRFRGDAGYQAEEINTTGLNEGNDVAIPRPPAKADVVAANDDTADFIDVMVVYTTRAKTAAGGTAAIETEIDNGIAAVNSSYGLSGVLQQVRLVHAEEIAYAGDTATPVWNTVLDDVTDGTNGLSSVAGLRDTYGADIVSFWIEGEGAAAGTAGIGWILPAVNLAQANAYSGVGFNVVRRQTAIDNNTFAHEMGHNMGLEHDLYVSPAAGHPTFAPYAHGYIDLVHQFRTIMAYDNQCNASGFSCTRVAQFSSPTHTYTGFTTGNASTADASRALNESALMVANFRPSVAGPGVIKMKVATQSVSESAGTASILVSRTAGMQGAVSVDYVVNDGTAAAGTDFTAVAPGTLNWADGDVADKTISVTITNNSNLDGNRNFSVVISNPQGGATLGTPTSTTATIQDDEIALQFAATTASVNEGAATNVNVAVNRLGSSAGAVSVHWDTSNGTAVAGTDFGVSGNATQRSGTLNWAAGDTAAKNITVGVSSSNIPIINNSVVNPSRDFTITLSSPTGGAALGANTANTVTINDTDSTIQFDAPTLTVSEAGPNMTVNVTRLGSTATAQAVTFTTAAGTAMATSDFTTTTGTITFAIGETTKVFTVGPNTVAAPYVKVMNDTTIEGPETFTVTLSSPTGGALLGAQKTLTVTINSDENGVSMATASRTDIVEGAGTVEIFAQRSGSVGAVDVNFAFTNGTAVNGTHYQGVNGSLHWNDGETGQKSALVNILDDSVVNTNRTFTVTLSGATGATLVTPMSTMVTIKDNDNTVQFAAATASVTETTASIMIPVSRLGVATGAASVHWSTADGGALAGTDFGTLGDTTQRSGTLNWAAGSAASQNITIPILPNGTLNGSRNFQVLLDTPTGALIGVNSAFTVTINDDERGVKFAAATYSIQEKQSTSIKVSRVGATTSAITATWATVNGTAISGTDFGVKGTATPRTGSLSWAIGDGADKTITIPSIDNVIGAQPDRSFTVTLTPGSGVLLGSPGTTTVTITDDDIPPQSNVRFDVPKVVVLESVGNVVLTLHREDAGGGFGLPVDVKVSTVAGTALATSDYIAVTNANVHWNAGDNSDKTISIGIVNNAIAEPTEWFKVVLSSPTPGLGLPLPAETTITILDDDEAFPLDGVIPAGFSQSAGSTKGWHVSNDPAAFEGAFALKTDEIDDGETAGLDMTGFFAAGTVTFHVKISSEPNFDVLQFYVDGVLRQSWSGTAVPGWQTYTTTITPAAIHTLRWLYVKDASVSVGADAAYIDGLVTPSFTP